MIGVGLVVLLLWIPLRQRPGLGTISNALVVGLVIDATLTFLDQPASMAARAGLLVAGVVFNGVATGLYIGAGLGPGPRDGLMTGLAARGRSISVVRTAIELTVLVVGWILGGTVGVRHDSLRTGDRAPGPLTSSPAWPWNVSYPAIPR